MTRARLAAAALLLVILSAGLPAMSVTAQGEDRPRLLVVPVVDQIRDDYLERMASLWTRGMKRLPI
jgi:hypothetical protein